MSDAWLIMIVDDSPEDRADVRRLLLRGSERRFMFVEFERGAAALRYLRDEPTARPDCLVLDYNLPDLDAPELLAELADSHNISIVPVVVITGHVGREGGQRVLRAGAQDYIGKDWLTPPALVRAVENAVDRWTMARALQDQRTQLEQSQAQSQALFASAREHQAHLKLALQASHTGIWSWDLATDAVTWSPECYEIHGLGPAEFRGTGEAFFALVHPDDRPHVERAVRAAAASKTLYSCEFRVLRPDGKITWVENLGRASYSDTGQPLRMLGTITNATERKQADEARVQSEERLTRAQRAVGVGTWDWNIVSGEAHWTDEAWRLFGRKPFSAPVSFEFWLECIHPDDRAAAAEDVKNALATGTYRAEFRVLRSDATIRWLESAGETVTHEGLPIRLLGTVRDVTERRASEQTLRSALRAAELAVLARDQLVSLVSHDLRSPLGVLAMDTEFLSVKLTAEQNLTTQDLSSSLSRMTRQVTRMNKLIDELLDVAQLHAGRPLVLEPQEVELVSLVRSLVDDRQRTTRKHRIELRPGTPKLLGRWDAKRIERVVDNLLSNAIKYSPAGGTVVVELGNSTQADDMVTLRVQDHGIGISPTDYVRIFDWFARGGNAERTTIPGVGIGLASAKQIVDAHHGSITVDSGEGRGTAFIVTLPRDRFTTS